MSLVFSWFVEKCIDKSEKLENNPTIILTNLLKFSVLYVCHNNLKKKLVLHCLKINRNKFFSKKIYKRKQHSINLQGISEKAPKKYRNPKKISES